MSRTRGMVCLVGAGPGDPGLITVRGLELLRRADVVVHDRLVGQDLLAYARSDAEIINVGKMSGHHRVHQARINAILVDRGGRGRNVVRLKGGDPYLFGRGFEEMTACRQAGIDCVMIPGVSSALAAPAAVGIPITDRHSVRSLAIITARMASDSAAPELDYQALAHIDTLVVLMGRAKLPQVAQSLIDAGRDPATPAACIEWATTPKQRVSTATLATIAEAADRDRLRAPVVTVVGEVAVYARDCDFPAVMPWPLCEPPSPTSES